MRTFLKLGLCPLLALGFAGCGSSLPTESTQMTSEVVGTAGGMLASSDGFLRVAIPAGALPADVTLTIVPTTPPGSGAIGTVYEIGPTGTQFAIPATLTFAYSATSLGATDPSLLRVATFAAGSWQILSGASLDPKGETVSGTTTHLSPYGITSVASGAVCATVSGGVSCSGGGTAGVSGTVGGSSAGDTSGAGGSGGATNSDVLCAPSTCAEAINPCGLYPGATMTGCTDGPDGYAATCCFPPGGSICLQAAPGTSGCSVDCVDGGACTTTCPPPPTCADATTATACGGLTGATLQSCVDGTSGYTAACCFAPGAPVCTTVGAASSCGGSTNGPTTCAPAPTCADGDPCAGITGTTMQSCTDSADGYTAVCCLPVGEVPSSGSSGSGTSTGGGVGGISGGSGTAGVSGGGPSSSGEGGGTGTGAVSGGGGASSSGEGGGTGTGAVSGGGGASSSGEGGGTGTGATSGAAGGTTGGGGVPG